MQNLEAVRDEIKAALLSCDGTPTAKVAALLAAAGISDTKEIAEILGVGERAIQKVKKANSSSPNGGAPNPGSRTPVRNEPQDANSSSEANHSSAETEPEFGRARVEENNLLTSLVTTVENNTPLTPRKPKRGKPTVPAIDILAAFEAWNETALRCALSQANSLTPERKTKIGARLAEVGLDGWKRALANIERSSYLTGANPNGWRADLKFFLRPDNFHKVHDGGYGNGRHAATPAAARPAIKWIAPTPEELRAINA